MNPRKPPALDGTAIRNIVRSFLQENLLLGRETLDVDGLPSFMEARAIDSTGFLELVVFVQERFGIHVSDDEIVPPNFDSLDKIVHYVHDKLQQR